MTALLFSWCNSHDGSFVFLVQGQPVPEPWGDLASRRGRAGESMGGGMGGGMFGAGGPGAAALSPALEGQDHGLGFALSR